MKLGIYIVLCASMIAIGWFARGERIQKQIVYVQTEQAKQVEKVESKKAEREIIYKDRIKVIHEATADCLSQPLPPDILRLLQTGPYKSSTDQRLRLSDVTGRDVP